MESADIFLLAVVGYIAVTALVRMMLARRDSLLAQFRAQWTQEAARRKRQQAAEES